MGLNNADILTFQTEQPLSDIDNTNYMKLFYKAFDISPALMAISSIEDGVFVDVNQSWLEKLGYNKEEIIGCSSQELNIFVDFEERRRVKDLIIRNGSARDQLVRYKAKTGEIFHGLFSGDIIELDHHKYLLTTAYDVTERIRLQEMEEKNRRLQEQLEYDKIKSSFLANISHELKTPISIIYSSLQLFKMILGKDSISDIRIGISRHADIMMQNCYRMIRLVNNLIDVTKAGSGYLKLNLGNCNIAGLIRDITLSVSEYCSFNNIDISFNSDSPNIKIACDAEKIERIVLNLLSNAIKFTPSHGKIYVNVFAKTEKLIVSVKDTGIGIPKSKQKNLFRRFYQVNNTLSRPSEGSGIGLSLSKSLANLHNGDLYLNRNYDGGCEFILELPMISAKSNNKSQLTDQAHMSSSHLEMIKIEFSDIYFDNHGSKN